MKQKINALKKVSYVAVDFATGLVDLELSVRKPDGSVVAPAPVFVEQGDGVYTSEYTPDALGIWQEKVTSISNGDKIVRTYETVNVDINDVKTQTDVIETKVDTVDGKVDAVDGKADTLLNGQNSIENKIDGLDNQIKPGGYFA